MQGVDEGGRMGLARNVRFTTGGDGVPYVWGLALVVSGMAGAITLEFYAGGHRSQGPGADHAWVPGAPSTAEQFGVGVVFVPAGLTAHAYRPWPVGDPVGRELNPACSHLVGGRCYSQPLDGPSCFSSGEMLRVLANPGGEDRVWESLEGWYLQEFCPPVESERIRVLEAAVAALQRADVPPTPGQRAS